VGKDNQLGQTWEPYVNLDLSLNGSSDGIFDYSCFIVQKTTAAKLDIPYEKAVHPGS